MELHDIVKWTSKDVDGKIEYTGLVVSITDTRVELDVDDVGIMGLELSDGKFKVVGKGKPKRKPKAKKTVQAVAPKAVPVKPKRAPNRRVNGALSNKALAISVYRDLLSADGTHPNRSVVVQAFVKYGFSKNTASTYQHNCKTKWCL